MHGFEVDSIDYTDTMDPDVRVDRLVNVLKHEQQDIILVGSSMGGYVSLVASAQVAVKGVFLLAPALYISGYKVQEYPCNTVVEIVHGWSDDVIPPENSIKYAQHTESSLHLINGDHRLNSSMEEVTQLFNVFLNKL